MNYKKEYKRAKTKLQFVQAIFLTTIYASIFVYAIIK